MKSYSPQSRFVILFALFAVVLFSACNSAEKKKKGSDLMKIHGKTMGTSYNISYIDTSQTDHQKAIDRILRGFDDAVSTYNPKSIISSLNAGSSIETGNSYLLSLIEISRLLAQQTGGAFDPTIMPAVRFWGFDGKEKPGSIDTLALQELMTHVGIDKIHTRAAKSPRETEIWKEGEAVELDLSAVAKGYGVDLIAAYLRAAGIENYLVEIGGEMVSRGKKETGGLWRIAIDRPEISATRKSEAILELDNVAIASSGNYRNFYEIDGKKIVHTIDPSTGFSRESDLLSVTVMVKDLPNKFSKIEDAITVHPCAFADAYATACMVMGKGKATIFIESLEHVEALFISTDNKGNYLTEGTSGMDYVDLGKAAESEKN